MMDSKYIDQVSLLLKLLPAIAKIPDFALHGGTAINLFHHNMPRLSVDIDLTFLPYTDRQSDLNRIHDLLTDLAGDLARKMPALRIEKPVYAGGEYKLFCTLGQSTVKIEVNTIIRGVIAQPEQTAAIDNQFMGMSVDPFTNELFEKERVRLLNAIHDKLTETHKETILGFVANKPKWFYGDWSNYPGIKWKLQNLSLLEKDNPSKFKEQRVLLKLD